MLELASPLLINFLGGFALNQNRHERALLIPTSAVRDLASTKPWVWLFTRGSTQQLGRIEHRSVQLAAWTAQ